MDEQEIHLMAREVASQAGIASWLATLPIQEQELVHMLISAAIARGYRRGVQWGREELESRWGIHVRDTH
jgi:hypothetical protein